MSTLRIGVVGVVCVVVGFSLLWVSTQPTLPALPEISQLCESVQSYSLYEARVEEVAPDRKWIQVPAKTFDSEALKGTSERVLFCQSKDGKLSDGAEFVKRGQQVRLCIKNILWRRVISCIAFL